MLRTIKTLHTAMLAVLALVLGTSVALAQSTSVSMVDVAGMPGDTVWVPIKVTSSSGLSGVQVNISVADGAVAEVSGFNTDNTVAGDIKAAGGFEQVGASSYVVANASAVAVTKANLIVVGFALKAEGSTTATVDVTLSVGDNPPVSEKHTLTPKVIVSNTVLHAPSGKVKLGATTTQAVSISGLSASVYGYQFDVVYDPAVVSITGADLAGTLSDVAGATFSTNEVSSGRFRVVWAHTSAITGDGTLLNLNVEGVAEGSTTFTFENVLFTDNQGNTLTVAPKAGTVTVEANVAPVFTNAPTDAFKVYQGATLSYDFDATDANGDAVTFFLGANAPEGATIDSQTGAFTWSVALSVEPGDYNVTVSVTDGVDTTSTTMAVEVLAPETIATVRGTDDGTMLTTEGVVTRAMGRFAYIQDGDVAITLFQSSGAFRDAIEAGEIKKGDRLRVYGEVATFRELKEIYPAKFLVVSENNPLPEPQQVTVAELAANGENYEAELITLYGFDLDTRGDSVFSASTNYPIKDATVDDFGLVDLRIPSASDTEWEGQPIPQSPLAFTGVLGQFDTKYQLLAIELSDIRSVVAIESDELPQDFALKQSYPNPFRTETTIQYQLPEATHVRVVVYDVTGRVVRTLVDGDQKPGYYSLKWDGRTDGDTPAAAGTYIYRVKSPKFTAVRKVVLVR